ncbi:MAG TPA: type 1 glutamine amidotransferase domain-containing protein [Allosphingosinicella sp.]|jgi:protease I|nr:type 1 glutamine amidotransferase domain-containing protein [Allosphingosinicella sp.]
MPNISEAKILMIATDGYEDSELLEPRRILSERGAEVTLASLEKGDIEGDNGATASVDCTIDEVDAADYDALVLPGGTKNPDKLRMDARVVATIRAFAGAGKPVAAICHGPWLLVEADLVRGRRVTGWPSIRTDLRNAGGQVVDEEAVTDGNIVTSRKPEDIPAFTDAVIALVERAKAPLEAA